MRTFRDFSSTLPTPQPESRTFAQPSRLSALPFPPETLKETHWRIAVEAGDGVWAGVQPGFKDKNGNLVEPLIIFLSPETRTSLGLHASALTAPAVRRVIQESNAKFEPYAERAALFVLRQFAQRPRRTERKPKREEREVFANGDTSAIDLHHRSQQPQCTSSIGGRMNTQWRRHRSRRNVLTRQNDVTGERAEVIFAHPEDADRFLRQQKNIQVAEEFRDAAGLKDRRTK
jgi:hypothetical protein